MQTVKGKFWAILVQTDKGETLAVDTDTPISQGFHISLSRTKNFAKLARAMGRTSPDGKARFVRVTVEIREA
jgi:hypothetical protein